MMTSYERALAYLNNMPPAVSGAGGHGTTFQAALALRRFGLSESEMLDAMRAYNARCTPPWSEKELKHKIASAAAVTVRKPFAGQQRPAYGRQASRTFVAPQINQPALRVRPLHPLGWTPPAPVVEAQPDLSEDWLGVPELAPDDGYWDFIEQEQGEEAEL